MGGIDVSKHNGVINWDKVKESGVEFAFIRIGYGGDNLNQDDKQALRNCKECDRVGIPYGLYIYSYALSKNLAKGEVNHMIRFAKQVNATLGYYYDMEDADGYKEKHNFRPYTHRKELTDFCLIFISEMRKAGYDNVGVYANYDYFKNVLYLDALKKAKSNIWLAQWSVSKPSIECDFWQYTNKGSVLGIVGNVDMNIAYVDVGTNVETKTEYYPVPEFTLIDAFNNIGVDSSLTKRKKIAAKNGISNYRGTAEQNMKMYDLLMKGKLIK